MSAGLLIIDRDSLLRSNLDHRLRIERYRIFTSDRPDEIMKMMRKKRIDVVLLNLVDLRNEGLRLLTQLKALRPLVEVILINQSSQIALSIEGMKRGAFDDFLLPFDMNQLLTRIQDAIALKKQRRSRRKTFREKIDDIMIAVSFAEAGEIETARQYLNRSDNRTGEEADTEKGHPDKTNT
ncbi:MAG: response regulator [bacterium]